MCLGRSSTPCDSIDKRPHSNWPFDSPWRFSPGPLTMTSAQQFAHFRASCRPLQDNIFTSIKDKRFLQMAGPRREKSGNPLLELHFCLLVASIVTGCDFTTILSSRGRFVLGYWSKIRRKEQCILKEVSERVYSNVFIRSESIEDGARSLEISRHAGLDVRYLSLKFRRGFSLKFSQTEESRLQILMHI